MGRNQHVVPHGREWAVRAAGSEKATSLHQTQEAAIQEAKAIAKNQGVELFVHSREGQIRERNSYGNDPYPPRG